MARRFHFALATIALIGCADILGIQTIPPDGTGGDASTDVTPADVTPTDASVDVVVDVAKDVSLGDGGCPRARTMHCNNQSIGACASTPTSGGLYAFSENFTIEAWVYLETADAGLIINYGSGNGYGLEINNTGFPEFFIFTKAIGKALATSQTVVTAMKWTHIAGVLDSSQPPQMRLYVDGSPVASTPFTDQVSNPIVDTAVTFGVVGSIDDVKLTNDVEYTAAFTPAATAISSNATVALYNLDESGGITTADSSSNNVPATLSVEATLGTTPACQ